MSKQIDFIVKKATLLAAVGIPLVATDLFLKHLARTNLSEETAIWVFQNTLYITLSKNYDKILAVVTDKFGLFYVIAGTMFIVILVSYFVFDGRFSQDMASIFALSGGFSNISDKIVHGYGTDYIGIILGEKALIFNLADIYIVICMLLFMNGLVFSFSQRNERERID